MLTVSDGKTSLLEEVARFKFDRKNPPHIPIWVYHGTSRDALTAIQDEGVEPNSYWAGTYEEASSCADSYGCQSVVIACQVGDYDFESNRQMAECSYEQGDIEKLDIPEEDELAYSLEFFNGVVCRDRVFRFEKVNKSCGF